MKKRTIIRVGALLLAPVLLILSLFGCAERGSETAPATTAPASYYPATANGEPAVYEGGMICNRFRSLGACPVALPAGVADSSDDPGFFRGSSFSETAYRELLSDLEADGFAAASYESGVFLLRDDCAVSTHYDNGSFSMYWYRTGEGAPENGISVAEAKTKLCGASSRSQIDLHPIDVTPRGFFERTGGQIFAVPFSSGDTEPLYYYTRLYFVRGETVCIVDYESVAVADVDGDGNEEVCLLASGPTSGLFTFGLNVIEGDNVGYSFIYDSPGELSFTESSGELVIQNRIQRTDSQVHLFRIGLEEQDGKITPSFTRISESRPEYP